MSFRYYDSILALIAENISKEKRSILTHRTALAKKLYYDEDAKIQFMIKMGIIDTETGRKSKMIY